MSRSTSALNILFLSFDILDYGNPPQGPARIEFQRVRVIAYDVARPYDTDPLPAPVFDATIGFWTTSGNAFDEVWFPFATQWNHPRFVLQNLTGLEVLAGIPGVREAGGSGIWRHAASLRTLERVKLSGLPPKYFLDNFEEINSYLRNWEPSHIGAVPEPEKYSALKELTFVEIDNFAGDQEGEISDWMFLKDYVMLREKRGIPLTKLTMIGCRLLPEQEVLLQDALGHRFSTNVL